MKIFVTGAAGFIGFSLTKSLLKKNHQVYSIDNMDNYYSLKLKTARIQILKKDKNFHFKRVDLANKKKLEKYLKNKEFDIIFHFAAQAGVRYSKERPDKYIKSNLIGFSNLLSSLKNKNFKIMFYSSSSSVYGDSKIFPLRENAILKPKNLYAKTKIKYEKEANKFAKTFGKKLIGLRFFTVYGKYGRPDMFIFKFLNALLNKKKFYLYNKGNHHRDYTHIDDVVNIVFSLIKKKIFDRFQIFNICSNNPVDINKLVKFISKYLNIKPNIIKKKRNKIEVLKTHGDNKKILKFLKIKLKKNIFLELPGIIHWYKKNKIWKFCN